MSGPSLHLLHTQPDARLLAAWVARHHARHERQPSDLGDALHGLLRAAFGDTAPQPFRYLDERQGLLAYTAMDANAMRTQVALADPVVARTLGLGANGQHDGYHLRPFPTQWPQGQVLGFEVRLRPTVRAAKGERDAFLHAVERAQGARLQREAVYVQWLREHLAPREGAAREAWQGAVDLLNDVHLVGYQRQQVVRRTQAAGGEARRGRVSDGPDALLKGHLRVVDPVSFAHLLARGIGRHRAFGFGMLLPSRAS
ncbi:type I-E CRISPR-associated protein Cas6/Cse3/CasE [Ottowia sp.]|jgi:CRISPR system Cascade subunit CasE|uniref:type I-E CRISPR-associated protein Cas6/Cse3/CasE n=1 Tax=Ottowia sp. TaxID=1898956 RepID=UPI0025DC71D6|nr:type I-E CRISPR-associated protein Cas6/Cse3/CasE [Ottowia sp.]MBK6614656.1 type I-E CRISPR-associated protein Cas6/Cse3/CasE [Ottowia sp.]MBK6745744.1 type I-E CRISPR-associated protein Cas6/Cse3/CasE [Ottowia sp.]